MQGSQRMIRDIEAEVAFTRHLIGKTALDPRVMRAIEEVPREKFVPKHLRHLAFANGPLPIGHGQTISQPFIVALMTDLVQPDKDRVILEVGTGCGYQAAVLARLASKVYSLEIVPELAEQASSRLQRLGYSNVEVGAGDGSLGWPEKAPFDGILVTAAAPSIPPALVQQLRPGRRMVIPVGLPYSHQELCLLEKRLDGEVSVREVLGVAFVPLTGGEGASASEVR
jgi:protein-L-isoaspartate(D-aspartate) O-methyltransferase